MPSPFPGMDPFLEAPGYFHSVHQAMIFCLREQIQPLLPEPYYADLEERTWVEVSLRSIEPDVNVLRGSGPSRPREPGPEGPAVASGAAPVVVQVPHDAHRESYLDIYARFEDREQVVTTVEILSISNKTPGERGRDLYLKKQREVLESRCHLVEIDLLRAGVHTTAVSLPHAHTQAGEFDYHVCVHPFDRWEEFLVYPIPLSGRLPVIDIPLLPGDGSVPVDLQAALDRSYDTGPYRRRVRYTDPIPPPALRPEQAAWVGQVLREKGLLPGANGG